MKRIVIFLVLSSLLVSLAMTVSFGQNAANVFLKKSTFVERADPSFEMKSMLFAFKLQNEQELKQLLEDQQDPNSPQYHQWITPEEFGRRFGAPEEKYQAVVDWLRHEGFSITHQYPNRLSIYFDGTASQVEKAFGVAVGIYEMENKRYYSNDRLPVVPQEFQDVAMDVLNLDSFPKDRPAFRSGSRLSMGPSDMWTAYNFFGLLGSGINGGGQTIAIVARTDFNISDVQIFRSTFGLLPNSPQKVFVSANPGNLGGNEEGEVLLDTEWSGAMAPNATIKVVISPDITTSIDYIVNNLTSAHVMSISFGFSELQRGSSARAHVINIFSQAASEGQTVLVSSGDQGAQQPIPGSLNSDGQDINYLCASPHVVCVGGTNLNPSFDSNGNATGYGGETAWSGSGGGKSSFVFKPSYQFGLGVPNDGARDVPDVAAIANTPGALINQSDNGGLIPMGGTSLSAPLWAGVFALVNQAGTGNGVGWANPRIYEMGRNEFSGGPAVFHDVTNGSNSTSTVLGFFAGTAFDQVTGWGSFNGDLFVRNFTPSSSGGITHLTPGTPTSGSIPANFSTTTCVLSQPQYTVDVPTGALQLVLSATVNSGAGLLARYGQPVTLLSGGTDFISAGSVLGSIGTVSIYAGPQSTPALAPGTYYIALVNCASSTNNFTLTATVVTPSSTAKVEEMAIDDGGGETGVLGNGLVVVNRLSPPRYPSTLKSIRVFVNSFSGQLNPVGNQIRLIAFADPSSSGRPPGSFSRLVDQLVTISGVAGFVDFNLANGPTISSGDWYVGFQYPNPGNGVLAAADTSGTQRQRSFFSNDNGTTFLGPLLLNGSPANLMIRGVVENDTVVASDAPIIDSLDASFLSDGSINLSVTGRDSGGNVKTLTETRLDSSGQVLGGGTFDISANVAGRTTFNFSIQIAGGNLLPNTSQIQLKLTDGAGLGSNTKTASLSPPGLNQTIPVGGAATNTTPGTGGSVRAGYAIVTVNSGAPPYGTAVFSVTQNGVVVSEAGVPASPPTTAACIFIDYRSAVPAKSSGLAFGTIDVNTGLAMVNRGSGTANISYLLRDGFGGTLAAGNSTLALNNHQALFINELNQIAPAFVLPPNFSTTIGFATLEIRSSQPLSIVALRLTTNQRGETLLTTTPVADLNKALSSASSYLAQFVDGGGYKTAYSLMNTSTSLESGTLRIFDDNGAALAIHQIGDPNGSFPAFSYSIQPGGFVALFTDGAPSSIHAGSIQLVPNQGTFTPVGAAVFSFTQGGILVTESGVPTAAPTNHARIYVDKSVGHDTGLAIAAPNGSPIFATLRAFLPDGTTSVGSGSISLSGNGHTAGFAGQFMNGILPNGFTGVLDISSSNPFVAVTLRSLSNARGDFLLTTFPIADFNQTAPFPIVFPQIADGGGYRTQFIQLGTSGSANSTLTYYGDNGSTLSLSKSALGTAETWNGAPDVGEVIIHKEQIK
jgi:hypothetical protein